MKKGVTFKFLISASLLLVLTSCTGQLGSTSGKSEASLSESGASTETSSVTADASGTLTPSPSDRGNYNTSYLGNAFKTSFNKNGWRMVWDEPSLEVGLSTYTALGTAPNLTLRKGSTNNIILTSDSQTLEMKKNLLGIDMAYNCNNVSLVAGALSLADMALPASSFVNQDANMYFTNDTLYWDFLDENGEECTGLSSLMDLLFEGAMSALSKGAPSTEIEFQHKGKFTLEGNMATLVMYLGLVLTGDYLWSNLVDPMIQSLWQNGAEITTTEKTLNGEKVYDMAIKTDDPSVALGSTDSLESVAGMAGSLPADVGSMTDRDYSNYFSTFEYEMHFIYTMTTLKTMSQSIRATANQEEVKRGILEDTELKAGDTELGLESLDLSSVIDFTFDDNLTIDFPSFDGYVEQELPEMEISSLIGGGTASSASSF